MQITSQGGIGKIPFEEDVAVTEIDLDIFIRAEKTKLLCSAFLWHLMKNDKNGQSPCLHELPQIK